MLIQNHNNNKTNESALVQVLGKWLGADGGGGGGGGGVLGITNTHIFIILIITDAGAQVKTCWNVFDGIDEFHNCRHY